MSNQTPTTDADSDQAENNETSHLDDLADGSGCTEIWEKLSEQREAADD
ncbi:hypothetical protein [Haladaptatus sp. DJG-WS-42]